MLCLKGHCNFCKVSKDLKSPTQYFQESRSLDFVVDISVGEQSQTQTHHTVDSVDKKLKEQKATVVLHWQ
jgi:hypothetical protein